MHIKTHSKTHSKTHDWRRFRALALSIVLVAGCSGNDSSGNDSSGSTETSDAGGSSVVTAAPVSEPTETGAPDSTTDTTAKAEFEPTTLTLWAGVTDPEGSAAFQGIVDRCETDNPWLTIDFVGKDDMSTALPAAIEAGNPPDLVQADFSGQLAGIDAGGLIEPIDGLFARDGLDWGAFVPGGKELVDFNGQHFGLPFSLDTAALFYNQDALTAAGIAAPPATFEELLAAAEKLLVVNADGSIERIGFVPDVGDGSYALFLTQLFGATMFSDDGATITITDTLDQWVEALQWQKQFFDLTDGDEFSRWADGLGSYDSADNFFINGQLPLYFEGSYFITWPDRFGGGKPENWGVVPMPGPDGVADADEVSLIPSGNWFMIPTGVDNLDASWEAVKCMALAGDEIAAFQQVYGNIPANVAALDIFEAAAVAEIPEYQTFIDLARSPAAVLPDSAVVAGALRDEVTSLILDYRRGDLSDDDLRGALEDLQARYQEELDLELGN